jgi:hypothetical protein
MPLLYKYRSIRDFKRFTEILLSNKLYAAKYSKMNDPMEGAYLYHGGHDMHLDIPAILEGKKQKLGIVSLSRTSDNELMWAHYADGHHGVAIGIQTIPQEYKVEPIKYDGIPRFRTEGIEDLDPIELLSHKSEIWEYEKEERIFVSGDPFAKIKISEVICGKRMKNKDFEFIRDLANKINPDISVKHRNH